MNKLSVSYDKGLYCVSEDKPNGFIGHRRPMEMITSFSTPEEAGKYVTNWLNKEKAIEQVREYIAKFRFIDPAELAKDCSEQKPATLIGAAERLVEKNELKRVWRIKSPQGDLIGPAYSSPENFPDAVPDRLYQCYFPINDCEIIPGYEKK
ncbi:MAG: hypothetical protein DWQ19_09940 [Crenarchaeota archaeon]|nr:MAG: hypothetical protein DWQ19_09940 [Thermoproteota archaeon]